LVGLETQGVVSYDVTIVLDVQDERLAQSMSASADFITEAKTDALTLPSSAVKSQGDERYVEVLRDEQPASISVEVGLSSDARTEILSGLAIGDRVITRTVTIGSDDSGESGQTNDEGPPAGAGVFRMMK
ncbi:hypothetical protein KKE45_04110, partial [Patescibacteria group bacterium]|nr:hypothetical protein [Patescibacteria group bacterium]